MALLIKKENVRTTIEKPLSDTNSPFTNQVMSSPISDKFKIPSISNYGGIDDPITHIEDFQTHLSFYNIPDEAACQIFPLTLKEKAREWFDGLESVDSFDTIKRQFLDWFSAIQKKKTTPCFFILLEARIDWVSGELCEEVWLRDADGQKSRRKDHTFDPDQRNENQRTLDGRVGSKVNHVHLTPVHE